MTLAEDQEQLRKMGLLDAAKARLLANGGIVGLLQQRLSDGQGILPAGGRFGGAMQRMPSQQAVPDGIVNAQAVPASVPTVSAVAADRLQRAAERLRMNSRMPFGSLPQQAVQAEQAEQPAQPQDPVQVPSGRGIHSIGERPTEVALKKAFDR